MASASDNKLACASEVAKAMNDIMRFRFSCTPLLDIGADILPVHPGGQQRASSKLGLR